MSIDINAIQNEFIRVAEQHVGSDLYNSSSVYKSRDNFPTSNYPYITLDILSLDDSGNWLLHQGINQDDNPFYKTHVKLLLQYTVYGDDSLSIASKLKSAFRINRVLNEITTNTGGAVENVFSVNSLPEKLATRYLEVASFNLTFNINEVTVDNNESGGYIDRVRLDGELSRDEDEETNPLDLDIDESAPST